MTRPAPNSPGAAAEPVPRPPLSAPVPRGCVTRPRPVPRALRTPTRSSSAALWSASGSPKWPPSSGPVCVPRRPSACLGILLPRGLASARESPAITAARCRAGAVSPPLPALTSRKATLSVRPRGRHHPRPCGRRGRGTPQRRSLFSGLGNGPSAKTRPRNRSRAGSPTRVGPCDAATADS